MGSSSSFPNNKSKQVIKNKVKFVTKPQHGRNKQILNKTNARAHNGGIRKIKEDKTKPKDGIMKKHVGNSKPNTTKLIGTKPKPKKKLKRGEPPPPSPPKTTKEELIEDLNFTIIDEHAINAPNELLLKSYWDLVKYLTDDDTWEDLWKVRSIYKWITSYNIKSLPIDFNPPPNSPLEYFSKIQCDMGNYANLFYVLCQLADVPCVIIDGIAKSSAFKIGEKINKRRTKAQWNAVLIDGEWRLVDLFWASTCVELNSGEAKKIAQNKKNSYAKNTDDETDVKSPVPFLVNGKEMVPDKGPEDNRMTDKLENGDIKSNKEHSEQNKSETVKPKVKRKKLDMKKFKQMKHTEDADDCYFLTDPRDLLWTHLPDDEDWQLAEKQLPFLEFEKRVYVRERLYELGIGFEGKHNVQCKHKTKQGKVSLDLKLPRRWAAKLGFRYNFYRSKSTAFCKEDDDGSLEHCVEWEVKGDILEIDINIPVYGQFRLDLFAKNPLFRAVREFDLICSYIVYSPMPPRIEIPLPDHPELGWGQNKQSDKFGLKPISHKLSKISTDTGQLELKFQGQKNLNLNVRLKHRILEEGTLSQYSTLRWHDGEYILNLRLPKDGYYAMKLYGKTTEPGKSNLLNYLIRCRCKKPNDEPFPILSQTMLGEAVLAKSLGIRVLDKENGIATAGKGRGKIHICSEMGDSLMYEMHSNDPEAMKRVNLIIKNEHGIESVHYILPVAGEYFFSVYTHKDNDITKLYTVYTSLIHSTGSIGDSVFSPRSAIGDNKGFWHGKHIIPIETIEATEKEVYLPYPESPYELVAYLDTNQGNGPQKTSAIEKVIVDDEVLFKVTVPDINYCAVNVFQRNDGNLIKTINKYFITTTTEENSQEDVMEEDFPLYSKTPDLDQDDITEKRKEYMRKKMREAEYYKDPEVLNNLIYKYEDQNPDIDDSMLINVKRMAKKLEARQVLLDAYESRNIQDVERGIALAQIADVDGSLQFEVMHAKRLLNRLKMIHRIRETIMEADGKAIGEGRKYANPPKPVKHSLMATLVLLGFPSFVVEDWSTTQGILWKMDNDSIQNKMARFDPTMCPLEFALDAKKYTDKYSLDFIKTVSPLGTAFYVWTTQMIREIESMAGTLGGYSDVYHDNDVESQNYNDNENSNREPVTTGVDTPFDGPEMPPVNNPPTDRSHRIDNYNTNRKQPETHTGHTFVRVTPTGETN
ncbi:uncharacterized protein LOC143051045 [Mytilus galloprovincialis]|uniref:uncharacterized protein LOC143051045 n=1 Tax=Mytilus galloprovincialis TaxID=29158 RepID=UPI003F7C070A